MSRLRAQWDWAVGFSLMGLGAVLVVVASVGVSGSRYASDQLAYMVSGGLGGLLLLGAGATLLITAGMSDQWRKLDRLEDALATSSGAPRASTSSGAPQAPGPSADALVRRGRLLAGAGMLITVIFLVFAWVRASGEADPEPGLEAIGTGVIGLLIGSLVAASAMVGLKHRVQLRKSRLFAPWFRAETAPTPVRSGRVLVAAGLTRFHLSGCPAVAGMQTREINRGQIPDELEPCELCGAE